MHMFSRGAVSGAVVFVAAVALAACSAVPADAIILVPRPALSGGTRIAAVRRPAGPGWRIAATRHYGAPGNASGYSAVLALSKTDAWVFGGTNPGGSSAPVAEHWNGHAWQASALPAGLSDSIFAASAVSAHDIWAVSYLGGYILHWNGSRWRVARTWPRGSEATGITAISPSDAWVFGSGPGDGRSIGTWHFNGTRWQRAPGRAAGIYRASAVSGRDVWAITAGPGDGAVLRYTGRSWKRVRTGSALARTQLTDILAVSSHDVWVVGDTSSGRLVLAHWSGRRWRRHEAPGRVLQGRLASDGHGGAWITGLTTAGRLTVARILHFCASGGWDAATVSHGLGNGVSDLALIPGTRSLWASGGFLTRAGGDVAIWRYQPPRHAQCGGGTAGQAGDAEDSD